MIFTYANILARVVNSAALAYDYAAGLYCLTAEEFDSKSFAL
jgi:hypothetical protein